MAIEISKNKEQVVELFNGVLDKVNGYRCARVAKERYKGDTSKMTYGEITSESMVDILDYLNSLGVLDTPKTVLDIGSGAGKFVLGMAASGLFAKIHGVEILEGLYEDAINLKKQCEKFLTTSLDNITFTCQNAFEHDFSSYDIFYSNSPVDHEYKIKMIEKISKEAKNGALVISTISPFHSDTLKDLKHFTSDFTWGNSTLWFTVCQRDDKIIDSAENKENK